MQCFRALVSVAAVLTACVTVPVVASAQENLKPRLVLNTLGPGGRTMGLGFSNDSHRLFACGFDKNVHTWNVRPGPTPRPVGTYLKTMRWEIARGYRGVMFAMDVSPAGEQVAVGGVSARFRGGDVIIFDTALGEVEQGLPPKRDDVTGLPGHQQSVVSVSWSTDGRRIASVSKDGEILIWTAPDWTPSQLRPARKFPGGGEWHETHQPAVFLNDRILAVSEWDDRNPDWWYLRLYDVLQGNRPVSTLQEWHKGRVTALARAPHGSTAWASADEDGKIFLWNGVGRQQPQVLRRGRIATSLSFRNRKNSQPDLLAAANRLDQNNQTVVELWDLRTRQTRGEFSTSTTKHTPKCAISPDGSRLAAHDADTDEVLVFPLVDPKTGADYADPLNEKRLLRLGSRGSRVNHVAFRKGEGYRVGFRRRRDGPYEAEFDLNRTILEPNAGAPAEYHAPGEFADGWRVEVGPGKTSEENDLLHLNRGGVDFPAIELDRVMQGRYRTHCFIHDGKGNAYALAVGTAEQYGVYVYRLPQAPKQPPLLIRYYRDHQGDLTSLGVSGDGKYLVSASEDQSIKIWSLLGLNEPPAPGPFRRQIAWGANFIPGPGGNGLRVASVLPPGIAAGRDLKPGDVITKLVVGTDRSVVHTAGAAMVDALHRTPVFVELVVERERGGKNIGWKVVVPGWEPMLTLFVDRAGDWAAWTPEGFFDSSIGDGDELLGFQINRGVASPPRILKAANLQRDMERPEMIRKLLSAGSMPGAFQQSGLPAPPDPTRAAADVIARLPETRILSPTLDQRLIGKANATVIAEVRPPNGEPAAQFSADFEKRFTMSGFANGLPLTGSRRIERFGQAPMFRWDAKPLDEISRFVVKVEEKQTGVSGRLNSSHDEVAAVANLEAEPYTLHVVAIAATKYGNGGAFSDLDYPVEDAKATIQKLRDHQANNGIGHYSVGEALTLFDEQLSRKSVQTLINDVKKKLANANPQDLLIVLVHGHGFANDEDYYFIPPGVRDEKAKTLRAGGVPWTMLSELSEVPCRKVVVLDTCHSGNAALAVADGTQQLKASIRRFKRKEFMVLAATSEGKEAFQGAGKRKNSFFTEAMLAGLDGSADGAEHPELKDGDVYLQEWVQFVVNQVKSNTGRNQVPTSTPKRLIEFVNPLPIVPVPEAG